VVGELRLDKKELSKIYAKLMSYPNVVGVGVGEVFKDGKPTGEIGIVVYVSKKVPKEKLHPKHVLPREVKGIRVDVQESGRFVALGEPKKSRTDKWRPAPAGVSIGHYKITAGTLGYVVFKETLNYPMILSNNHVLAKTNEGEIGDPITQPGPYDGGRVPDDVIAHLEEYVPIKFERETRCPISILIVKALNAICSALGRRTRFKTIVEEYNLVDAALGKPIEPDVVSRKILEGPDEIVGHVNEYNVGDRVCKSGRTTGITYGVVSSVDATVRVGYAEGIALFVDQIIVRPENNERIVAGGDSGSLVYLRDEPIAYGLLFAGSTDGKILVANKITNVIELFNIRF